MINIAKKCERVCFYNKEVKAITLMALQVVKHTLFYYKNLRRTEYEN